LITPYHPDDVAPVRCVAAVTHGPRAEIAPLCAYPTIAPGP
jgi:hypothetical protein